MRSSSSKLSTTIERTPASIAALSSSMLLLLPCIVHDDAGTPALRATCSSPPLATSSSSPSSTARRAIARHRNAFVAYTTWPAPNAATASRHRARTWATS